MQKEMTVPSGYNIRPQIEARDEARLQVQRRYQRQYHRLRRVRVRLRGPMRPFTREELARRLRRLNPEMEAATFALWLDALLAEQTAWGAQRQEARP
jgi:hypothetical protein